MRPPVTNARLALQTRMTEPAQESVLEPAGNLPPYMESFLAHIRLLVGVPFEYLIPDDRLLPQESIRFFYVDRSWTDRLVDGAIAVGQIGSREGAHYQAHASDVSQTLDQSERMVRDLQRKKVFDVAKADVDANPRPAQIVTGFIMRSSAVKNWPHMDVRAYDTVIDEPFFSADAANRAHQLNTLRLELLAPSVMIALFEGEPAMVILEEPHHGVQFGVRHEAAGLAIPLRNPQGEQVLVNNDAIPVAVPVRSRHNDVVRIEALRDALEAARLAHSDAIEQSGSGAFAISVLDPPWRQHFQGTEDHADTGLTNSPDPFFVKVASVARSAALQTSVKLILAGN